MQLDEQSPVFRKEFIPWYDTNIACSVVVVFTLFVFIFSLIGISSAHENVGYQEYVWVPTLLAIMSFIVMISNTIRLLRRYIEKKQSEK
ncbi:MAG: hypothetical protein GY795_48330 [Desulfobacterales bacterium]|nr:hypothetical protein [Desulfobacterales bacterium]